MLFVIVQFPDRSSFYIVLKDFCHVANILQKMAEIGICIQLTAPPLRGTLRDAPANSNHWNRILCQVIKILNAIRYEIQLYEILSK